MTQLGGSYSIIEGKQYSEEEIPDVLDTFDTLPTQVGINRSKAEQLQPNTALDRNGPLSFHVPASDLQIDPGNMYLIIKGRLVNKEDYTRIPLTVGAGPPAPNDLRRVLGVNGTMNSLFKNYSVKINNTTINQVENLYGYRADLETRLGFCKDTKKGSLSLSMFDEETVAFEDLADAKLAEVWETKGALGRRFDKTAGSKEFKLIGQIHQDLFQQSKLLPPMTSLDITFDKQKSDFYILSREVNPRGYAIEVQWARLFVRHVEVEDEIKEDTEKLAVTDRLSRVYPVRLVAMKSRGFSMGINEISFPRVVQGKFPRKVIFGLVKSDSFHGINNGDPYNYKHYNANHVALRSSGAPIPYQEINMDFSNNKELHYMPLFQLLQTCNALFNPMHDIGLSVENYKKRNTLYGFDLTASGPARMDGGAFEKTGSGALDIEMTLDAATPDNVTMVVYLEYDGEIHIDPEGNVSVTNIQETIQG
jgi:hypothetical protein